MGLDVGILASGGGGGISQSQLDLKADDDSVVHNTGAEDVYGSKTWYDPQTFASITSTESALGAAQASSFQCPTIAFTGGVEINAYDDQNIDYLEATNAKTSGATTNLFYTQPSGVTYPVMSTRWMNAATGEIILLNTGAPNAVFTFSRGQYGTTPAAISIGDQFFPLYEGTYAYQMYSDLSAGAASIKVNTDGVAPVTVKLPDLTIDPWSSDGVAVKIKDHTGGAGTGSCVINVEEATSGFSATIDAPRGLLPLMADIVSFYYSVEGNY